MPDIYISERQKRHQKEPVKKTVRKRRRKFSSTKGNYHPLASYCFNPGGVKFETQESEERVVLLLRKHPITNAGWIAVSILMLFAPAVLFFFPLLEFLPANFKFVAILGWYLITIAFALQGFLTWFFNVYIVTDERVVDIDFYNLIYKEVSDANIDKIQDVTYKMGGAVRTMFNYGDVVIQTAGETPNFNFEAVPTPDKVASVLQDLRIEEEQEKLEGRVR